jgi:cytochrome c-type biogenesis protein
MNELFESLSHAVEGSPAIALGAAFIWGVLSVVLSPCHLASIPLIVAFISGQGSAIPIRRAAVLSTLFSLGILITIGAIGALTAAAGRLLGVLPIPWAGPTGIRFGRRGFLAALMLGLIFGIAVGPCTFAYMAPMLAVTFRLASTALGYGVLLLVVYGLGHCAVIVLAGTFTEVVQRYLDWNEHSRGAVVLRGVCGALVIIGGLFLIYTA